jgi:Family of unknown function (DUF6058)
MAVRMTPADVAYVRSGYVTLHDLCAHRAETPDEISGSIAARALPRASYVLEDGTEMFPEDYFALADAAGGIQHVREHFRRRFLDAGGNEAGLEEEWESYLSGDYGVCLRRVTPEHIVRKDWLVREIETLLDAPAPAEPGWRGRLRSSVDELDALERPFAPQYDRARWGPSSRDRCVTAARVRFPEVFEAVTVAGPQS